MTQIARNPVSASKETYDLIVIGGGIYGVMLSLEAALRGLHPLLIERDDFGGATSFNSLRIIHGGLRYLQSMDLHRFRESVNERQWFLKTFPHLVKVLPCLMPLYGDGLRRPWIFSHALRINDFFSRKRNEGVSPDCFLPPGRVLSPHQTERIFPSVDKEDLQGGALWYDAFMPDSQRLLMEVLRCACEHGATALNYVEARQPLRSTNGMEGVLAVDRETGEVHEYRSNVVVNACGPWCRSVAAHFDEDREHLFRSSVAWNVLLNRRALSDHAVAVAPKKPHGRIYFLVPWKGKLLAGTGHAPRRSFEENPKPSSGELIDFLNDLNLSVPFLAATPDDILHVFSGLLPVTQTGSVSLSVREVILHHADQGGPRGLYSVSGVKFTTARLVAEKTLKRIFPPHRLSERASTAEEPSRSRSTNGRGFFECDRFSDDQDPEWKQALRLLIEEESVQHLDDLVFRRTDLWENPTGVLKTAPLMCDLFEWDDLRRRREIVRLRDRILSCAAEY